MKQHSKRGALQLKMLFAAVILTLSISASTGTVDYSRSCYNPSAYNGTATYTNSGQTDTCDSWYSIKSGSGQVFENVTWGNVNVSTFPSNAVGTLNMLKGSCCSDGKGILWNAPAPSPAPSANITSPAPAPSPPEVDLNTDDSKRRVSFHFIVSSIMPTIFALILAMNTYC